MNQTKPFLLAMLAMLASSLLATGASAVTYAEVGDAGQSPATSQVTGTVIAPLTAITGVFAGTNDADVYTIYISNVTTFAATTVNAQSANLDTALFLFTQGGLPVITDDDAAGGLSLQSTLPAGNSIVATLTPGVYLLGISQSGNEATNTANQLVFNGFPGGDSTATRGEAPGLNPRSFGGYNSGASGGAAGSYQIDLTSVLAVPEPSALASLFVGALGLAGVSYARRGRAATV